MGEWWGSGMGLIGRPWVITAELVEQAELESHRLFEVIGEEGYPPEWPVAAWLLKRLAGGRCEHCGRQGRLAVHHLDRDKLNLQHWNLVALCWDRCHLWVETHVSLDRYQLELFGEPLSWLVQRIGDRERWPRPPQPAAEAGRSSGPPPRWGRLGPREERDGAACACGCGAWVPTSLRGRPRRFSSQACRQRVYRESRRDQLSLLRPAAAVQSL